MNLSTSERLPAAQGTVNVETTNDNNTQLELKVEHLAPPGKVVPNATNYVVWAQSGPEGMPQNLGALQVDEDLNGEITTLTPLKNFRLFITPEASPIASLPTGPQLFWTNVSEKG